MLTPELASFLDTLPGRCPECRWHIVTQGHSDDCSETMVAGDLPTVLPPPEVFDDAEEVDRVLAEFIRRGQKFSANDYHSRLDHIRERNVIGARVREAARRREIRKVGFTEATDAKANGRTVAVWQPI